VHIVFFAPNSDRLKSLVFFVLLFCGCFIVFFIVNPLDTFTVLADSSSNNTIKIGDTLVLGDERPVSLTELYKLDKTGKTLYLLDDGTAVEYNKMTSAQRARLEAIQANAIESEAYQLKCVIITLTVLTILVF